MAGLAHLGAGFALQWLDPKAKLIPLLVAAEVCDLLIIPLLPFRLSPADGMILTHGLFMTLVWVAAAALLALLLKQRLRAALVYAAAVYSHWVLDFITHPMGAVLGAQYSLPDMPLVFRGSVLVGLGLYNHSYALAVVFDLGVTFLGLAAWLVWKRRQPRLSRVVTATVPRA